MHGHLRIINGLKRENKEEIENVTLRFTKTSNLPIKRVIRRKLGVRIFDTVAQS